jgi:hypothetical protein
MEDDIQESDISEEEFELMKTMNKKYEKSNIYERGK